MSAPKGLRPLTRVYNILRDARYDATRELYILTPEARAEGMRLVKSRDASSDTPDAKRKRSTSRTTRTASRRG